MIVSRQSAVRRVGYRPLPIAARTASDGAASSHRQHASIVNGIPVASLEPDSRGHATDLAPAGHVLRSAPAKISSHRSAQSS